MRRRYWGPWTLCRTSSAPTFFARRAAQGEVLVVYDNPWAFVFGDDGEVCLSAYRRSGDDYELMFDQVDSGFPNDRPPFHGGWFLVPALAQGFACGLGVRSSAR